MIVDDYKIKLEVIKLAIMKHTGREISEELLNRFCKYLTMEYENNTSKNSIDNRINSICFIITNPNKTSSQYRFDRNIIQTNT